MGHFDNIKHKASMRLKAHYHKKGYPVGFEFTDKELTVLMDLLKNTFDNSENYPGKTPSELEDVVVMRFITWRVEEMLKQLQVEKMMEDKSIG